MHTDAFGNNAQLGKIDAATEQVVSTNIFSVAHIQTLYGFHVDPVNNVVYLLDAKNYSSSGTLFQHNMTGGLLRQINTGYLPKKVVIFE